VLPKVVALTVTAPEDTEKSVESKEATPLLLDVASSAAIVTVVPVALVSIPSPPVKVKVSPIVAAALPESLARVISLAVIAPEDAVKCVESKEATPLFDALASSASIVRVTSVPDLATAVLIPSPP